MHSKALEGTLSLSLTWHWLSLSEIRPFGFHIPPEWSLKELSASWHVKCGHIPSKAVWHWAELKACCYYYCTWMMAQLISLICYRHCSPMYWNYLIFLYSNSEAHPKSPWTCCRLNHFVPVLWILTLHSQDWGDRLRWQTEAWCDKLVTRFLITSSMIKSLVLSRRQMSFSHIFFVPRSLAHKATAEGWGNKVLWTGWILPCLKHSSIRGHQVLPSNSLFKTLLTLLPRGTALLN